jgi:transposase
MFDSQTLNRGELLIMNDKQLSESMCLQDAAMNLLATGYSMREVAEVLGVNVKTIYDWQCSDPSFRPTVMSLIDQVQPRRRRS